MKDKKNIWEEKFNSTFNYIETLLEDEPDTIAEFNKVRKLLKLSLQEHIEEIVHKARGLGFKQYTIKNAEENIKWLKEWEDFKSEL